MRIAVVLSGCGVYDGSEIHESVLTMLALDRRGAEMVLCAPDMPQAAVVDHLTGRQTRGGQRNVLVESARIARGAIRDVATVTASEVDGLVLPGGYGAARNLSDFASLGEACAVQPDVARLVREMYAAGKPIAALCIAPAVLARLLGSEHPRITVGRDADTAAALEAMGAVHVACGVRDVIVDAEHRVVTSPAYMLAGRLCEVADGIDSAVGALVDLAQGEMAGAGQGPPSGQGAAVRKG